MYETFPAARKRFPSLVAWDLEHPPAAVSQRSFFLSFSLKKKIPVWICELTSMTVVVATVSDFYRIDGYTSPQVSVSVSAFLFWREFTLISW